MDLRAKKMLLASLFMVIIVVFSLVTQIPLVFSEGSFSSDQSADVYAQSDIGNALIGSSGSITYPSGETLFTGFEFGLGSWAVSAGSPTIVSDIAYSGECSLRCRNNFNFVYEELSDVTDAKMDFFVKIGAPLNVVGEQIMFAMFMQSPWTWRFGIGLTNVGGVVRWTCYNGGSISFSSMMVNPNINTWYHVQLQMICNNTGNGTIRLIVNNVELSDLTRCGVPTSFPSISKVSVGMIYCSGWSSSDSIWIDDVRVTYMDDTLTYLDDTVTNVNPSPLPSFLSLKILSPIDRYYTSSKVPIELESGAGIIQWNIYNGTHWLYSTNKSYTGLTYVTLGNGEYKLYSWISNTTLIIEETVLFGVNLRNTGAVYAAGGSNTEIQKAINSASNGDAVYLPAGTFAFDTAAPWTKVSVPAGISIYGAPALRNSTGDMQEWRTVLTMPYDAPDWSWFFEYTGSSASVTRVTGIKLVGYREFNSANTRATNEGIRVIGGSSEYRFDHLYFRNLPGTASLTIFGAKGVVDHCVFINYPVYIPGVWDLDTAHYAINFCGPNSWLPLSSVVGKYNPRDLYIEDNFFSGYEVCVQTNNAGHYVFRFNEVVNGMTGTSLHWNLQGMGGRCAEVYNNTFVYQPDASGVAIGAKVNCGTLICTNNTFIGYGYPSSSNSFKSAVHLCQGNPTDASWSTIQDTYIWNNVLSPSSSDLVKTSLLYGTNHPKLNSDYFLRAPSIAKDGWEYKPYVYPHPLVF